MATWCYFCFITARRINWTKTCVYVCVTRACMCVYIFGLRPAVAQARQLKNVMTLLSHCGNCWACVGSFTLHRQAKNFSAKKITPAVAWQHPAIHGEWLWRPAYPTRGWVVSGAAWMPIGNGQSSCSNS